MPPEVTPQGCQSRRHLPASLSLWHQSSLGPGSVTHAGKALEEITSSPKEDSHLPLHQSPTSTPFRMHLIRWVWKTEVTASHPCDPERALLPFPSIWWCFRKMLLGRKVSPLHPEQNIGMPDNDGGPRAGCLQNVPLWQTWVISSWRQLRPNRLKKNFYLPLHRLKEIRLEPEPGKELLMLPQSIFLYQKNFSTWCDKACIYQTFPFPSFCECLPPPSPRPWPLLSSGWDLNSVACLWNSHLWDSHTYVIIFVSLLLIGFMLA